MPSRPVMSDSFAIPWTAAHQAPQSMGFSRQEYRSGLPCPPPRDLPDPGNKPTSPVSPALNMDSLPLSLPGKPHLCVYMFSIYCLSHVLPVHKARNPVPDFQGPPHADPWCQPGQPQKENQAAPGKGPRCVCVGISKMPKVVLQGAELYQGARGRGVAVSNQLMYLHKSPEPRAGNTGGKPKIKTDRPGSSNQASVLASILLFSDSMDGIKQTRNSVGVF